MGESVKMKDKTIKDGTVDAIAAVSIILLVVATAVFWVSNQ